MPIKSQNHLHQGRYRTYLLTMASHFPKSSSLPPITTVSEIMDGQSRLARNDHSCNSGREDSRPPAAIHGHLEMLALRLHPRSHGRGNCRWSSMYFSQAMYANLLNTQIQKAGILCETDPMRNICGSSLTSTPPKHDCPARIRNTEIPKHPDNKMTMY